MASTPAQLDAITAGMDAWLEEQLHENPIVDSVEQGEPGERRWYVRVKGEDKDVYSVWFTLGQRTLHFETYFMPAPEENTGQCYEHLLKRNNKLYGIAFAVGAEGAIYLVGQLANTAVSNDELDRILGTFYATIDQCFRSALRIGFASRFS